MPNKNLIQMNQNIESKKQELLTVNNLEVQYSSGGQLINAVNGMKFSLYSGETLGLVGETGAGKTTTALSLLRLLPQKVGRITNGEIIFEGNNLLKLSEEEMRKIRGDKISMIFQDPMTSLNPVLTVGEQVAEAIALHNKNNYSHKEINDQTKELFSLVGIPTSRMNDYPHQFSGGMKQRVVIAISLACNPKLIIADEPTTALDVTIQAQVLFMMANLKDKFNTAMLLITHDLGVVAQICDWVAVVYAGRIVEYGAVREIFGGEVHHPYTDGLFGSIPNLKVDCVRLKPISGLMPDPSNLPKGCSFNPRCPQSKDICRNIEPEMKRVGKVNIACHLFSSL